MFNKGQPAANFPQFYDSHINITIPYYQAFHLEIINLIRAVSTEPELWLDTGCGTGILIEKAAEEFTQTRFIVVDPSPAMLQEAKKKLAGKLAERIILLASCPTQDINLSMGGSPDVITAVLCHHYLNGNGRKAATIKCFKLLKPGGIFISFENIRPMTGRGTEIGLANWKSFQIEHGKPVDEAEKHILRFGKEFFPITIEEHLSLLKEAGFRVVELLWYSYLQAGFYAIK